MFQRGRITRTFSDEQKRYKYDKNEYVSEKNLNKKGEEGKNPLAFAKRENGKVSCDAVRSKHNALMGHIWEQAFCCCRKLNIIPSSFLPLVMSEDVKRVIMYSYNFNTSF